MELLKKCFIALTFLMLIQVLPATAQEEKEQKEWTGKLQNGKILTKNELEKILSNHKRWLETNENEGIRADLRKAILRGADLIKVDLRKAKLNEADLRNAILINAKLIKTILINANLSGADLSEADLSEANLGRTKLEKATLSGANLGEAILIEANLSEAKLVGANLKKANLGEANLIKAELRKANLSEAKLKKANLSGADLSEAILINATLSGSDLSGSDLRKAKLHGTDFGGVDLSEAKLYRADLRGAIFQPKLESIPKIKEIDYADNLSELTYSDRPKSLVALREEFKKGGMRKEERKITRAIKHTQMLKSWKEKSPFKKIEAAFNYVFFELTCQYGLKPGRPLMILLGFIFFFTVPYSEFLSRESEDGIWKIWIEDRARKDIGSKESERLYFLGIQAIRKGFFFSVLSAFSIGWRELNVGNWIARIQRREYILKATGWARVISGIQSLISVYLMALWVLTYFGRPFEAV